MEQIKIEVKDNQEQVDVCIVKCSSQPSGVQSVNSGTDITVDNTDPLNPIVSYIGAAVGGVQSVNSGTDISVDNTDPLNPIVNFDGDFIPLSGTEVGSPVTGVVEFSSPAIIEFGVGGYSLINTAEGSIEDDGGGIFIQHNVLVALGSPNTALYVQDSGVIVGALNTTKGLYSSNYYGANYDDNTYVQKKYVDDKIIPNKRLVNATTSGTFNLNHSLYSDWKLTLTGATTLTDSNLPTGDYTIEFTMKIKGSFGLTLPSYWSVNGDTYDGTKWNFFAVQVHKGDVGSEEVTVFITNLA